MCLKRISAALSQRHGGLFEWLIDEKTSKTLGFRNHKTELYVYDI